MKVALLFLFKFLIKSEILKQIYQKKIDKEKIADRVIKKPELLPEIYKGLSADKASLKYGCDKVLRLISEKKPELLYSDL